MSKGQLKVTHLEFVPQLQTFVVLIMLIFFTVDQLSVIYFSLLLTLLQGEWESLK